MSVKIPLKREGNSMLANGVYRLKVETVEEKNGPSGHPYLNMRYRVFVNGAPSNVAVWDILSLSPAARFKVDQFLESLNAPEDGEVSARWFEGKFVWASLRTGEYNGQFRNEIAAYVTEEVASQQNGPGEDGQEGEEPQKPKVKSPGPGKVKSKPLSEMEEEEFPI